MSSIAWILVIVVAVVIVGFIAWWAGSRRRSTRLRDQFGAEYDRTVESTGRRSDAEKELESRQDRVKSLDIRPLDEAERDRFRERWLIVQALFVDGPSGALGDADKLIGDVMRARGYPVGDFEQRAADVSVDHPDVVEHYRTAHAIATSQRNGHGDTEEARQAMVHYRALVSDLLGLPADEVTAKPTDASIAASDGETTADEQRPTRRDTPTPTKVPRRT